MRSAALALRDLLAELDLPSWVKTSGSKGFHLVVPLDGRADSGEVSHFAHLAGATLVRRHPEKLTQEFSKVDRAGRIYVDTGRNGFSATFAAAYAVRAKPGAPVSAPCSWEEIERGTVDPRSITLRTCPDRVESIGDLWEGLHDTPQSLTKPMEALTEKRGCMRKRRRQVLQRVAQNLDDGAAIAGRQVRVLLVRILAGQDRPHPQQDRLPWVGRQRLEGFRIDHVAARITQQACVKVEIAKRPARPIPGRAGGERLSKAGTRHDARRRTCFADEEQIVCCLADELAQHANAVIRPGVSGGDARFPVQSRKRSIACD